MRTAGGSSQGNLHQKAMLSWQKFRARRMWVSHFCYLQINVSDKSGSFCYDLRMAKRPNIQYVAAKGLILNDSGKILVLKQSDPTISGNGQFHPPGGIVEPGESVKECLVREIAEEIGVSAEVGQLVDVGEWYAERDDNTMQFIGIFYECKISIDDFKLQSSEVSKVAWVGIDDIDNFNIIEPSKSIIKSFLLSSD